MLTDIKFYFGIVKILFLMVVLYQFQIKEEIKAVRIEATKAAG